MTVTGSPSQAAGLYWSVIYPVTRQTWNSKEVFNFKLKNTTQKSTYLHVSSVCQSLTLDLLLGLVQHKYWSWFHYPQQIQGLQASVGLSHTELDKWAQTH